MKKRFTMILLVLCLLAAPLLCGFVKADKAAAGESKIRAVTYFGNEWPVNFWSSDHSGAEEDFRQIAADGFNSIILCVPWRQFQPKASTGVFYDKMFEDLNDLMNKAGAAGLGVILRVGYTWDLGTGESIAARYRGLLNDSAIRAAWMKYCERLYSEASAHENYSGAFLTWEDFWNFVSEEEAFAADSTDGAAEMAEKYGYSAYVREHYTFEQLKEIYGDESKAQKTPFPSSKTPAYKLFLEFYDDFLLKLLGETQTVFPGISMECRLDIDPYQLDAFTRAGYDHQKTFTCAGAAFSSCMLSANMGFENGTVLTAGQSAEMGTEELRRMQTAGGKPVFVDQFLYQETTPGFENNAKIEPAEVPEYIRTMGNVFDAYSTGFGIWTYRDYTDNIIYNPGFGFGTDGWNLMGDTKIEKQDGNRMARIGLGSEVSQDLTDRGYMSTANTKIRIRVISEEDACLLVEAGKKEIKIPVQAGDHVVSAEFDAPVGGKLSIGATKRLLIDDVKLYSHVTEGRIYDLDMNPGDCLEAVRVMNERVK